MQNFPNASDTSTTLTVTKDTVTITAKAQSSVYGTTPSVDQTQYSVTGLVNGDQLLTAPTLTLTGVTSASHVNTYLGAITAGAAAASTDYTISYVAGNWSVTPATLTITANPESSVYGTTPVVDPAQYSVTGLVNGDQLTTVPTLTLTGVTAASRVNTYTGALTASGAAASTDYTISYVAGNWSVTKAHLTVTADNKARLQDQPDPTFTAVLSGFQNGETLATSGVTGAPAFTSTDTAASLPGSYTIVAATWATLAARPLTTSPLSSTAPSRSWPPTKGTRPYRH